MYVGVCNNVYISHQCDTPRCDPCFEMILEEVTRYTPRYMEEMEYIFVQSQEKRKMTSPTMRGRLHLHVKAVYNQFHSTLMAINEQDKLRWWKNTQTGHAH
ncbi:unnamed protein product [Coregonus sp. 'balchen']|nr:unnamed protein product [Coregonus sp. 'balchen']